MKNHIQILFICLVLWAACKNDRKGSTDSSSTSISGFESDTILPDGKWSKTLMGKKLYRYFLDASKGQAALDQNKIISYAALHNLPVIRTESGLFYSITQDGVGELPNAGTVVSVVHHDYRLSHGQLETVTKASDPLNYVIGQTKLIPGWDEAVLLLKPGTKGTFFLPSSLAYGPHGSGNTIPPNDVIVFELERLK